MNVTLGEKEFSLAKARTRTIIASFDTILKVVRAGDESSVYNLLSEDGADKIVEGLVKVSECPAMTKDDILDAYPSQVVTFIDSLLEINEFDEVKNLFTQALKKYRKEELPKA
jgi:hypothetical protein